MYTQFSLEKNMVRHPTDSQPFWKLKPWGFGSDDFPDFNCRQFWGERSAVKIFQSVSSMNCLWVDHLSKDRFCEDFVYFVLELLNFEPNKITKKNNPTRWFNVTFWSPSWRSLNPWRGHLTIPKRSQRIARKMKIYSFQDPQSLARQKKSQDPSSVLVVMRFSPRIL